LFISLKTIGNKIKERKWRWIGHTLRKTEGATERADWTGIHSVHGDEVVQEKRGRRRLKKKLQRWERSGRK
jgi:hypothetical protein